MRLDHARLSEILQARHGFYADDLPASPEPELADQRLKPDTAAFIGAHLEPGMRVLDIGCGNGATLLAHSATFGYGVGVDNDPRHLALAREACELADVRNLEFRLASFDQQDASGLSADQPYGLVFTERGPFGKSEHGIRTVLPLLRPGGLIFAEVVGERHHREVRELFGPRETTLTRSRETATIAMERAGTSVRISADFVTRRYFPNIYEWLRQQCHIWAWGNHPIPQPDDPRLEIFAERNRHGEHGVVITEHVAWVGAVKQD